MEEPFLTKEILSVEPEVKLHASSKAHGFLVCCQNYYTTAQVFCSARSASTPAKASFV